MTSARPPEVPGFFHQIPTLLTAIIHTISQRFSNLVCDFLTYVNFECELNAELKFAACMGTTAVQLLRKLYSR